ncbi:hypothetical protein JNJ66_00635 [Candidatus Saccharibacteria bacterium]|nr:hypothetical protein [Candidatus Saccharibacteria bacterium]
MSDKTYLLIGTALAALGLGFFLTGLQLTDAVLRTDAPDPLYIAGGFAIAFFGLWVGYLGVRYARNAPPDRYVTEKAILEKAGLINTKATGSKKHGKAKGRR